MGMFEAADTIIVDIEGEHSSDPKDPGGDTWWGVARRYHMDESPWPPMFERAQAIRRAAYWDNHRCSELPWPFALIMYDGAINQGTRVVKMLQAAVGVPQDGVIGDRTIAAAHQAKPELAWLFLAYRARAYVEDAGFKEYGIGWLKRLFQISQSAVQEPA